MKILNYIFISLICLSTSLFAIDTQELSDSVILVGTIPTSEDVRDYMNAEKEHASGLASAVSRMIKKKQGEGFTLVAMTPISTSVPLQKGLVSAPRGLITATVLVFTKKPESTQ